MEYWRSQKLQIVDQMLCKHFQKYFKIFRLLYDIMVRDEEAEVDGPYKVHASSVISKKIHFLPSS
ncbi:hypothetical protein MtrunA17_Chr3g0097671 [Medicago truncatula]|uniref:Uncharacterized protein n=1 Tax=Medicago truncatula TaxID=3880 RepID=A0A396IMP6_MEDTR|nr:hypothetical protein MtrunA17_Chr3g0097671 [Medicago truncatula]